MSDIIGGACRAQARTIMSGVGQLFLGYRGDIIFQGGVAYNRAVAYYLKQITGNNIVIPELHGVMGALGAACLARQFTMLKGKLDTTVGQPPPERRLESINLRAKATRKDFLGHGTAPLVWRNLFFPTEILNALGARSLTLETYAALFARSPHKVKRAFDKAACKGFTGETCSFLRVLEGVELPKAAFAVSTSQPCQQGERIFRDIARSCGIERNFFSLQTPAVGDDPLSIEHLAEELEHSVRLMEKALGLRMDPARLREACEHSNEARHYSLLCNQLRNDSPPLIRGGQAIYFATIFSQLWGRPELTQIQKQLYEELLRIREEIGDTVKLEDTHRLLWLHLPPFYDRALLDFIELDCRAPIVFEEVNFIGWEPLDISDPYRSLAKKLLTTGFMDPALRVKSIVENAPKVHFNGCILYNHGFGRCSMSDSSFVKHLSEELNKAAVPLLVLDGDCVDPTIDPCSTQTKISAYIEALNEQKYGNIFGRLKA